VGCFDGCNAERAEWPHRRGKGTQVAASSLDSPASGYTEPNTLLQGTLLLNTISSHMNLQLKLHSTLEKETAWSDQSHVRVMMAHILSLLRGICWALNYRHEHSR
jgi:hypothetical protein